jgi:urease accessory protein
MARSHLQGEERTRESRCVPDRVSSRLIKVGRPLAVRPKPSTRQSGSGGSRRADKAGTLEDRKVFEANRARGRISLTFAATQGGTRCLDTREEGSLRVRFPAACASVPEAILVNTAGGIAGGDRFDIDMTFEAGARLAVTTASAEKVYRSLGSDARIDIAARLADGAELVWLPRETIMFNQARLSRNIVIELASSARLVFVESVVFGRTAMGETVTGGSFSDRWRVRRDGRLIFAENFRLDGAITGRLNEAAIAAGGVAAGTVLLVPGADVEAVRATASFRGEVGISAWNDIALARLVAPTCALLRHDLVILLAALGCTAVPRLWLS